MKINNYLLEVDVLILLYDLKHYLYPMFLKINLIQH